MISSTVRGSSLGLSYFTASKSISAGIKPVITAVVQESESLFVEPPARLTHSSFNIAKSFQSSHGFLYPRVKTSLAGDYDCNLHVDYRVQCKLKQYLSELPTLDYER